MSCRCSRPRGACVCGWPRMRRWCATRGLVLLALCMSCSGVQSVAVSGTVSGNPTTQNIAATVGVTITFAQAVDTAVTPLVNGDAQLTQAQKDEADRLLAATGATLVVLQDADSAYQRVASTANKCRLYAALDAAIGARVDILAALASYGVAIPVAATLAILSGGAIADAILAAADPACAPDAGSPGMRLRTIRARLRLQ